MGNMESLESVKRDFIQEFGDAYYAAGQSKLMGHIIGLLLFLGKPTSLDDITRDLGVSKGPTSQMLQRLRERSSVQRLSAPGDRRDYYQVDRNLFGNAFSKNLLIMQRNFDLAKVFRQRIESLNGETDVPSPQFVARLQEMSDFYGLMLQHFETFLEQWQIYLRDRPVLERTN